MIASNLGRVPCTTLPYYAAVEVCTSVPRQGTRVYAGNRSRSPWLVHCTVGVPCIGTASHTRVSCVFIESSHPSMYYITILCCIEGLHFCAKTGYTGVCREPEQESLVGSSHSRSTLHRYSVLHTPGYTVIASNLGRVPCTTLPYYAEVEVCTSVRRQGTRVYPENRSRSPWLVHRTVRVPCIGTASQTRVFCDCIESRHAWLLNHCMNGCSSRRQFDQCDQ